VAAWVPDMFCNFYLGQKITKLVKLQQTVKVEKIAQIWNPKNFDVCLTKFKNNQILLNKITH
jgi:hypothetical protein